MSTAFGGGPGGLETPAILAAVADALPRFLPTQRWYGAKEQAVARVDVRDTAQIVEHPGTLLAVIDVYAGAGPPSGYFLPLSLGPADAAHVAGDVVVANGDVVVRDAIANAETCRALLAGIVEGHTLTTTAGGSFRFRRAAGQVADAAVASLRTLPHISVRHANVEQSNSSVIFGEQVILKALRRLADGVHPEIELTQFLGERTDFDRTPALLGWGEYVAPAGTSAPVAVLQQFVPNQGDGWSYVLAQLKALASEPSHVSALVADLERLGQTLGKLHLALSSVSDDPAFRPAVISMADLDVWRSRTHASLDAALAAIRHVLDARGQTTWASSARQLGDATLVGADKLRSAIDGVARLADGRIVKTRHHGDFHLGQTLVASDGWYLIDFEGEPARTLDERRAKQTPLRDVAGLLRSLDYVRATIERQGTVLSDPLLITSLREHFLNAYVDIVRDADPPLLPSDPADLTAVLLALEAEKAIYELGYEMNNRPDWVEIPLAALARLSTSS